MYDRIIVKEEAKSALREYRGASIGVLVLYGVLTAVISAVSAGIGAIFLAPPLYVGYVMFYLGVWRREAPPFETLFQGFRSYTNSLLGILWMNLWIAIWSLLFIIPGIIKGLAYSMTPYLLADYPDLGAGRALKVSMAITEGRKAEIFVMHLSFLGWNILSCFTFGILHLVYVGPYMEISLAGMYEKMLADAFEEGRVTSADLGMA